MTDSSEKRQETSKAIDDGELWSFLRSVLSQGGDIWLDHAARSYEQYSARLDAAARERVDALKALISPSHETSELQRALHVIDEAGKLSDWINRARPVVTDLMAAYERRIRTDCTPEQLAKEPWRCMEYIGAENLLRDQPIAVVELTAQKASEPPTHKLDTLSTCAPDCPACAYYRALSEGDQR
jgi:hypothetical protein